MSRPDVVVIGGGIVGAAAAAYLAEAGAAVTLIEASAIAAGASGRNSGVVQHPFDAALRALHLETLTAYRELATDGSLGFAFPAQPAGLLLVGLAESGPRRVAADLATSWPELGPEFVDPEALRRLEPALAHGVSACRLPIGYPVPPAAATRALAALAERRGTRVEVGRAVAALSRSGDRTTGVRLTDGTSVPAGAVLVAAGPWSSALIDPTGRWQPIRPVWGVVVEVGLVDPPGHVLEEAAMDDAFGDVAAARSAEVDADEAGHAPADSTDDGPDATGDRPDFSLVTADGRTSLGSTFLDREPDPAAWIPRLAAHGRRFLPALTDARLGAVRVCARPVAPDGRPLIGPIPGRPGTFIAAGHGPWGISTGPASARLAVDAILGRPVVIPPELRADRFGSPG